MHTCNIWFELGILWIDVIYRHLPNKCTVLREEMHKIPVFIPLTLCGRKIFEVWKWRNCIFQSACVFWEASEPVSARVDGVHWLCLPAWWKIISSSRPSISSAWTSWTRSWSDHIEPATRKRYVLTSALQHSHWPQGTLCTHDLPSSRKVKANVDFPQPGNPVLELYVNLSLPGRKTQGLLCSIILKPQHTPSRLFPP